MRRMMRTPVRTPHVISSHTSPGVIDHLGTNVEPVAEGLLRVSVVSHNQLSEKAPTRNYRPLQRAFSKLSRMVFDPQRGIGPDHLSGWVPLTLVIMPGLGFAPSPAGAFAIII